LSEHGTFTGRDAPGRDALNEAIRELRLPATIRQRCANITAAVGAGESAHFALDRSRLTDVAKRVARLTQERFPGPTVPLHSRWRHFETGGIDRKVLMDAKLAGLSATEAARTRIDLAVISVLLDAGAGPEWGYQEPGSGRRFVRSEGLAVASFHAFMAGRFSSDNRVPMRVDGPALERFDTAQLAAIFQVRTDNPIVGLEGRVLLLQRLGAALRTREDVFGTPGRPGRLFDLLCNPTVGASGATVQRIAVKRVAAAQILRAILKAFSSIWPSGQQLHGKPIGDTWAHPQAGGAGPGAGRVPFHKLSQWLT
jgi:hypothetical protein